MKHALIRALRTLAQNLVPVLGAFVMAVGKDNSFAGIKDHARVLMVALFVAFGGAVVSFLQNFTEESKEVHYERGEADLLTILGAVLLVILIVWLGKQVF